MSDEATFCLSAAAKKYFGDDGTSGYFYRDLVNYWRHVAVLPFLDVLRGMPLPAAVRWPPPGLNEAEHLETSMRITAEGAIATLLNSGTLPTAPACSTSAAATGPSAARPCGTLSRP